MKLCVDCKHLSNNDGRDLCRRPGIPVIHDPVHGVHELYRETAYIQRFGPTYRIRLFRKPERCGEGAFYFEPKA